MVIESVASKTLNIKVDRPPCAKFSCRYLFGENVDGMAFVVFGVTHQHEKRSFPRSLQKVQVSP